MPNTVLRTTLALAALAAVIACAPAAAPPAPTAQAAAKAVATTSAPVAAAASPLTTQVASVVSPIATTAAAVASPVATQAAAAASPIATQVAAVASPIAAQAVTSSPIRITGAQVSPADTTFTLQNSGSLPVDLTGWRLRVGSSTAKLPDVTVPPGGTVTVHTASGTNSARDIYLGQEAAALISGLQPGASVALLDAQGTPVSEFMLPRL
jgi:competence protein ComEC